MKLLSGLLLNIKAHVLLDEAVQSARQVLSQLLNGVLPYDGSSSLVVVDAWVLLRPASAADDVA